MTTWKLRELSPWSNRMVPRATRLRSPHLLSRSICSADSRGNICARRFGKSFAMVPQPVPGLTTAIAGSNAKRVGGDPPIRTLPRRPANGMWLRRRSRLAPLRKNIPWLPESQGFQEDSRGVTNLHDSDACDERGGVPASPDSRSNTPTLYLFDPADLAALLQKDGK